MDGARVAAYAAGARVAEVVHWWGVSGRRSDGRVFCMAQELSIFCNIFYLQFFIFPIFNFCCAVDFCIEILHKKEYF